jgi:hypothetical protein
MLPVIPVSFIHGLLPFLTVSQAASERERLAAHAEVLALQQRLGISYKDASHRLYLAEVERMKADEKAVKAFKILEEATRKALETAYQAVQEMELMASLPGSGAEENEPGP